MRISSRVIVSACCLLAMFASGFVLRGFVASGTLNFLPRAQAQADKGPGSRKCSNRTLKGAYGIKFEGQKLGTGPIAGPIASIARITLDGEGNFTTNEIGSLNGHLIQRTFSGPYTVNEDCTGFLDFSSNLTDPPHHAHGDFIIVDEGKEFFFVDSEEDWVANGIAKRL